MNEWIEKSFEIANGEGYLDKLQEIYSVEPKKREISPEVLDTIKKVYESKDPILLLKTLINLNLERFPIDHPFVPFFKMNKEAIDKNPTTAKKIGNILLSMSLDKIFEEIKKPKVASRRMGHLFRLWSTEKLGFKVFEKEDEFVRYNGIGILKGSDETLMKFANEKLNCNLKKGIDLVAKTSKYYIIGEAKLLTSVGGEQYSRFKEALIFAEQKEGNAIRIAILDGIVWIKSKNQFFRDLTNTGAIALSALLLKDFIESLK
jgi:hypothetical protein